MLLAVCAVRISGLMRVENMMSFAKLQDLSTGLSIKRPRETNARHRFSLTRRTRR